jgi:hypothetical protein
VTDRRIGQTGVVGVLARMARGLSVWFRADMDANGGVREATGLPYGRPRAPGNGLPTAAKSTSCTPAATMAHVTWLLGHG